MVDQENVIERLQESAAYFRSSFYAMDGTVACEKFRRWTDAIEQAIALLKEQEPILITNADFENTDMVDSAESLPAWIEYRRGEEWDEYTEGNEDGWSIVYQFNFESEFYRCWTSRPTDEQREATPWN